MQTDPRKQFSKWLARYGAIFWGIYMLVIALLIWSQPEAAMACVWLALIVTANKMIDTWAYTRNSIYEKSLLAMLEKTRMELRLDGRNGSGNATVQDGAVAYEPEKPDMTGDEEYDTEEVSSG